MATHQSLLFNWENVNSLPDLERLRLALDSLPDGAFLEKLEQARGHGRNDYPVRPMWRLFLAGIVFQHRSIESLLREANRNPQLLDICGFNPLPRGGRPIRSIERDEKTGRCHGRVEYLPYHSSVPRGWNFSRFLRLLERVERRHGCIAQMLVELRHQLLGEIEDFGRHIGYDATHLRSHSTGRVSRRTGSYSDPDADWGTKTYRGVDAKTGRPWEKSFSWFGYQGHLIADTRYEIPIAFQLSKASAGESPVLHPMLSQVFQQTPELARRARFFSADRGLDEAPLRARLLDEHQIFPVIDSRQMWSAEKQHQNYDPKELVTRALYPQRVDYITYDESGRVYCEAERQERREMVYYGYEKDRNTLKFRCPAVVHDLHCTSMRQCLQYGSSKAVKYGRTVRIPLSEVNRRIFSPVIKDSRTWKREYARRSGLERIFSRVDQVYGMEHHFIRTEAKMRIRVTVIMAVKMAMALGHVTQGRPGQMRSLVQPVPFADTG